MKYIPALSVSAALALTACDTMKAPLTSSGSFDPLAPAGGVTRTVSNGAATFKAGQFVRATIDNTAFFTKRPKGDGDADKLLARDTQMKVISSDGSYLKVELDSGEVGYVPTVMVNDPAVPMAGLPGDATIYPPTGPVQPLPTFDTSQLPPPGSVPPIIDPAAPVPTPTPAAAPAAGTLPTPPPLPPGIDDAATPEPKKPQ